MTLRVIVTGAAGFVPAATVRALLDAGHEVLAWVRPTSKLDRLEPLPASLRLLRLDVDAARGPGRAEAVEVLRAFRPDAVLHAAWSGIRGAARQDPAQVDNVTTTVEVVRIAAEVGARRFVGVGSQAEYGPHTEPLTESSPTRPATLYGDAKLAAGQLTLALARRLGMSAAWVRLFSVYGPGERGGALLPDLVLALSEGRCLKLSSCEQRWDYLFVNDAAAALVSLLERSDAQGVFNLAFGESSPLRTAVEMVYALMAPDVAPDYGPRGAGPLPHLMADTRRLREATGWRPVITLDEGLRRTVESLLRQSLSCAETKMNTHSANLAAQNRSCARR
jgi:nucleoside-diphosphate-sugar epimerase